MQGTIKKLVAEKGFGFIQVEKGEDRFFHVSGMADGIKFEQLTEGQTVEFTDSHGERGPRAIDVRPG